MSVKNFDISEYLESDPEHPCHQPHIFEEEDSRLHIDGKVSKFHAIGIAKHFNLIEENNAAFCGEDTKAEYSRGILFIFGEKACGKTHHGEALMKFFNKKCLVEQDNLTMNELLPDSCLVLTSKSPVIDEDQDVLSFTQAMSIAGII